MDDAAKQKAINHIKNDVGAYPATKATLVAACNNMSEFTEEEKKWFMDNLPEGEYATSDDVMKAFGW